MKKSLIALAALALPALAADDRFWRENPSQKTGFLEARDPVYAKECGSCHFAYLPGLLPQRSWKAILDKPEQHFGESFRMAPAAMAEVSKFLLDNAADVSPFEGSKVLMERVGAGKTPIRVTELVMVRMKHVAIMEVINMRRASKIRNLVNCDACHTKAAEGDFAFKRLSMPGLTTDATLAR